MYAFIPGIALNKKEDSSHAFIQVINGKSSKVEYHRFPLSEFKNLSKKTYQIQIGNSYFSKDQLRLDIDTSTSQIKGTIDSFNHVPFPKKFLRPGIMGFLTYLPFLECYHGIVSMNHDLKGMLEIEGKALNFDDGKGYIEKDWGKSFPSAWIWTQSNHFSNPNLSFIFSLAKIPFLGMKLNGFLSLLWNNGVFYIFTTYTGAKIRKLEMNDSHIQIIIESSKYRLVIELHQNECSFGDLVAPRMGSMAGQCLEGMDAVIKLKLFDKKNNKILIKDTGKKAGLELMNTKLLIGLD